MTQCIFKSHTKQISINTHIKLTIEQMQMFITLNLMYTCAALYKHTYNVKYILEACYA